MPGGDRTGPMGQGPMSGRGAGYCAGYNQPGWSSAPMGGAGGWGGGRGGRRGRRRFQGYAMPPWGQVPTAPMPPSVAVTAMVTDKPLEQEFDHLQKQVELLSQNLEKIQLQLAELAKTKNQ